MYFFAKSLVASHSGVIIGSVFLGLVDGYFELQARMYKMKKDLPIDKSI